jgi:hypothetical protein
MLVHLQTATGVLVIWRTCHLGGHPFKYYLGSTLLDFGDHIDTGMSNVGRGRSPMTSIRLHDKVKMQSVA